MKFPKYDPIFDISIKIFNNLTIGESIWVDFTIKNLTPYKIDLLKWNTPLEGLLNDIFIIKRGRYKIPYDGKMVKRGLPQEKDYLTLMPEGSLSATIDITEAYGINSDGNYSIQLDSIIHDYLVHDEPQKKRLLEVNQVSNQLEIDSKSTTFTVKKNELRPKLTQGAQARLELKKMSKSVDLKKKGIKFIGGTSAQQKTTTVAHNKALKYLQKSITKLKIKPPTNLHYKAWFGAYSKTRYSKVEKTYSSVETVMIGELITYDLTGKGCGGDVYAYTYKNTRKIWMCSMFWKAPDSGFDTKFGTVIHELTHAVAGTDDVGYGTVAAKELAIKNPKKAVNNADNYEYFSESL